VEDATIAELLKPLGYAAGFRMICGSSKCSTVFALFDQTWKLPDITQTSAGHAELAA
jgi:hypothetical protein